VKEFTWAYFAFVWHKCLHKL